MIQARAGSTRLQNKFSQTIGDKPLLVHVYNAARSIGAPVLFLIPDNEPEFCTWLEAEDLPYWRGHPTDLVHRYYTAAKAWKAEAVVRLTGDCPLLDTAHLFYLVNLWNNSGGQLDFLTNAHPEQRTEIDGNDIEIISYKLLAYLERFAQGDREHCTSHIYKHWDSMDSQFKLGSYCPPCNMYPVIKTSVDTEEDLKIVRGLYKCPVGKKELKKS